MIQSIVVPTFATIAKPLKGIPLKDGKYELPLPPLQVDIIISLAGLSKVNEVSWPFKLVTTLPPHPFNNTKVGQSYY